MGIKCENGRLILLTRKNSPLGDGVTLSKMDGRPSGVLRPVAISIVVNWLVK